MNCILPKIWTVYLLRVDGCFYLVKIISFAPFPSVTLFKVINTLWQKLLLGEVCLNPIGERLNFIYSKALYHPTLYCLDWFLWITYFFILKKTPRQKSSLEHVTCHVLANLSILSSFDIFLNNRLMKMYNFTFSKFPYFAAFLVINHFLLTFMFLPWVEMDSELKNLLFSWGK